MLKIVNRSNDQDLSIMQIKNRLCDENFVDLNSISKNGNDNDYDNDNVHLDKF